MRSSSSGQTRTATRSCPTSGSSGCAATSSRDQQRDAQGQGRFQDSVIVARRLGHGCHLKVQPAWPPPTRALHGCSSPSCKGAHVRIRKRESNHDAGSERWACLVQVGAQVMLLRNLDLTGPADRMLVNGSRGVVRPCMPARNSRSIPMRQGPVRNAEECMLFSWVRRPAAQSSM